MDHHLARLFAKRVDKALLQRRRAVNEVAKVWLAAKLVHALGNLVSGRVAEACQGWSPGGSVEQQAYKAPFNSPGNRDKNLPATLLSAADRKMSWLRSAIWNLFLLDMRRLAMVS